jgi:maltose alpha-D-glucosyltransferase/alpha-amylase
VALADEPDWYKDAIIYELHVRAFYDSNGDGIGDFSGLVEKLDYLQDLGVTAVWLLPFYPSPLRDDGYDIADYTDVHPAYGTLRDFKRFLNEAHRRGIRVITELAINHTSTEHPWFQRARRAPKGSIFRDYYVWSDTPERYRDARIIFHDFESSNWSWDPVAGAYYWHRFYAHQPDLNFDNPHVEKAVLRVLDFWMDLGVDGLRLDAIPYLYEREGTNCENLVETHAFLKRLRAHVDRKYKNRMLLAEANQWPEDAAEYFGNGDECHMNFHFPVMPRMFMALQLENSFPIIDIMQQTPAIPDVCQWAVFLRNHDELTLEMVTDEDRDYMYRTYADDPQARINLGIRRRLAPLLKMRAKVELMNGLLFSLPGTPVLYYGDEIGQGDNIYLGDRNGVRTPMQWSSDRNAGFSRANPQKLYLPVIIDPEYHFEAINVEAAQNNPASLLWWMKRLIALRKQYKVFGRGRVEFLEPDNAKVLAFVRSDDQHKVLVVANLSRFTQYVELDMSAYEGMTPVELFGQTEFPRIGELPYLLTLGPHNFYWFELKAAEEEARRISPADFPAIDLRVTWDRLFASRLRGALEKPLIAYMQGRRWFRSKARAVRTATIVDALPLGRAEARTSLVIVQVEYVEGFPETYLVPLAFAVGEKEQEVFSHQPHSIVARLRLQLGGKGTRHQEGYLYEASEGREFANAILSLFHRRAPLAGLHGQIEATRYRVTRPKDGPESHDMTPRLLGAEQSNTNILFGHQLILKLFRQMESGINPDTEMLRYLTEQRDFQHVPQLTGVLEYTAPGKKQGSSVALLQQFVHNQGDAWEYTLDALDRFAERVIAYQHVEQVPSAQLGVLEAARQDVPELAREVIAAYLPWVSLLAQRTGELHLALAAEKADTAFVPEPFSALYQRSLYQSARARFSTAWQLLRRSRRSLPEGARELAERLLDSDTLIDQRLRRITSAKVEATRIRCHGDYHLGQVLYTGKDFVILDFEGEPALPLGVRRLKRSPLYDVCGMLRSFDYAVVRALRFGHARPDDVPRLEQWGELWLRWVTATFLRTYLDTTAGASFIPREPEQLEVLLDFHLLDKGAYELAYELNNRPEWVHVPLQGLAALLLADK